MTPLAEMSVVFLEKNKKVNYENLIVGSSLLHPLLPLLPPLHAPQVQEGGRRFNALW
jgi:hypothetical protein